MFAEVFAEASEARVGVHAGGGGGGWGAPAVHVEDRAEEVRLERVLAQRLRVRLERVPLAEIPCARRREPRDLGARVGVLRRRQQSVGDNRSGSNSGNGSGNETCSRPDSHSSAASAQSPSQSASACWQRIRPSVSSRLLLWPCSDCRRSYASRASAQRCSFSYHSSRSVTYSQSHWLRVGPAGVRSEWCDRAHARLVLLLRVRENALRGVRLLQLVIDRDERLDRRLDVRLRAELHLSIMQRLRVRLPGRASHASAPFYDCHVGGRRRAAWAATRRVDGAPGTSRRERPACVCLWAAAGRRGP